MESIGYLSSLQGNKVESVNQRRQTFIDFVDATYPLLVQSVQKIEGLHDKLASEFSIVWILENKQKHWTYHVYRLEWQDKPIGLMRVSLHRDKQQTSEFWVTDKTQMQALANLIVAKMLDQNGQALRLDTHGLDVLQNFGPMQSMNLKTGEIENKLAQSLAKVVGNGIKIELFKVHNRLFASSTWQRFQEFWVELADKQDAIEFLEQNLELNTLLERNPHNLVFSSGTEQIELQTSQPEILFPWKWRLTVIKNQGGIAQELIKEQGTWNKLNINRAQNIFLREFRTQLSQAIG